MRPISPLESHHFKTRIQEELCGCNERLRPLFFLFYEFDYANSITRAGVGEKKQKRADDSQYEVSGMAKNLGMPLVAPFGGIFLIRTGFLGTINPEEHS